MLLTYNISNREAKIRSPPVKSYAMMSEISVERFLEILKNKNRFLCILSKQNPHIESCQNDRHHFWGNGGSLILRQFLCVGGG